MVGNLEEEEEDNDDEDNNNEDDDNDEDNIFLLSEAKQTPAEQLALLSRASGMQF